MNENLNKYFENVNWMDLFKNPKYFNQDTEVKKTEYVPKPWEVKRNYQLERDNYDMKQLYCDDISDAEYLQNTFDFYKSTKLSLSDFLIRFDITRLHKFNYDKIRSDYELSKNKEQELRELIREQIMLNEIEEGLGDQVGAAFKGVGQGISSVLNVLIGAVLAIGVLILTGTVAAATGILGVLGAAGVGHIGIIDADNVDLSNLQRQVIHSTDDVGRPKVESAKDSIK